MPWLSTTELETYAPSAASGGLTAILNAQSAITAYLGYDLTQSQRVEILKPTRRTQTVHLSYRPIQSTPTPVIEVREGNDVDSLSRVMQLSDWYQLQDGDFVLDSTGLLSLNTSNVSLGFDRISGDITYVRATYTAGIDFSGTSDEVLMLKAAIGQVATYQTSGRYQQGLIQVDIPFAHDLRWSDRGPESGGIPMGLLAPFTKYKPMANAVFA